MLNKVLALSLLVLTAGTAVAAEEAKQEATQEANAAQDANQAANQAEENKTAEQK